MTQRGQLKEKFKKAAASVLPIVVIMGLIYVIKTRKAEAAPEYPYADDNVIELWDVGDIIEMEG